MVEDPSLTELVARNAERHDGVPFGGIPDTDKQQIPTEQEMIGIFDVEDRELLEAQWVWREPLQRHL